MRKLCPGGVGKPFAGTIRASHNLCWWCRPSPSSPLFRLAVFLEATLSPSCSLMACVLEWQISRRVHFIPGLIILLLLVCMCIYTFWGHRGHWIQGTGGIGSCKPSCEFWVPNLYHLSVMFPDTLFKIFTCEDGEQERKTGSAPARQGAFAG